MIKKFKKWLTDTPDLKEYMMFYKLFFIFSIAILIVDAIAAASCH